MQHNLNGTGVNSDIAEYFSSAKLPSQQEMLGSVVVGILRSGQTLNRKAICLKLMARLDKAVSPEEQEQLQALIGLLFRR
ncbi:regulatory protein YcgZ [Pantoea agglomerans]|uniref:regulatory protein YcgZ n=1 Tax=Enterobacter agglomerans TaxID=549 RepID=UPI001303E659|nr:regulatory protein YcgZ [Pantoea agglomerans]